MVLYVCMLGYRITVSASPRLICGHDLYLEYCLHPRDATKLADQLPVSIASGRRGQAAQWECGIIRSMALWIRPTGGQSFKCN